MASNSEEEFSFPASTLPCFIESPPLWRLGNSKTCKKNEQVEEEEDEFSISDDDYGQEDKMDMLWEGLNEDSSSSCTTGETCTEKSSNLSSPGKEVHICCMNNVFNKLPAAKSSRGDMKSSIPVFIRVLKKGFAIHHSLPSVKKCAAW